MFRFHQLEKSGTIISKAKVRSQHKLRMHKAKAMVKSNQAPPDSMMDVDGVRRKKTTYNAVADLMVAADRDQDGAINFSEYLLLRRALVAWLQCSQEFMNRAGLRCGLSITVRGRDIAQAEADIVFNLGARIMKNDDPKKLSFACFVYLADLYKMFSYFDTPLDSGSVS